MTIDVEKLASVIMAQMGWGDDKGARNTIRVTIKATLEAVGGSDADAHDVRQILANYSLDN